MRLKDITPETPLEAEILQDLNELIILSLTPETLLQDLKDDPEAYTITQDDLEAFAFKYEIPLNLIPEP